MMRYITLLLIPMFLVAGCSQDKTTAAVAKPAADTPETPTVTMPAPPQPAQPAGNPADVLVDVDGQKLTRGEAQEEARYRLAAMRSQIPPQQMGMMQQRMLGRVVDQFVAKRLLIDEADRREIEVTLEDEKSAFEKIAAGLPEGMTIEQVMKTSPIGEERMREEVLIGIRIEKLFAQMTTNEQVVTEQEIDTFIEENKESMALPERVQASHILFGIGAEADESVKAEKKTQAEEVRQELADGADFAAMATEHSTCPSKNRGGDLGTFGRGRMVKEFEDAAFSQDVDEIGPVVETKFGYHIIKVVKHDEPGQVPREKVTEQLVRQKKNKVMSTFVDDLRAKATIKYMEPQGRPLMAPTPDAPDAK